MITKRRIIDVKTHECRVCHVMFKPNKFTKQANRSLCANDDFWYEKTLMADDPNVARIDGVHYIIGLPDQPIKGMGGHVHKIAFYDGREVTTDNLWHQGTIPFDWRDLLFDNAEFVRS